MTAGLKKITLREWITYALFAAVTAVCSQIVIPLPFTPVPVNLGTLAVMLTGTICGAKIKSGGFISVLIYITLGAVGLPVFSNFNGGLGVLLGPTGGYIIGYVFMTIICGFLFGNKKIQNILALTLSVVVCYICGTIWFILSTGNGLTESLAMCVIPFIPGDVIKIIAAFILINKLKPLLLKIK